VRKSIECFYPGRSFPAISVTGRACSLNCKHCSRKYLEGMAPATTPEDLVAMAEALAERGAKGFLLSGGVDPSGKIRLANFAPAIEEIKSTTDLRINAHMGLTPLNEIEDLVRSGIDSFSVDLYGSNETIHEVLGLRARIEDYVAVLEGLREAGAPIIAPHICIGIHGGELKGEFSAIETLNGFNPRTLVLISLIPTKGTEYAEAAPPSQKAILSVIAKARAELPKTKIVLGCMRSKMERSAEADFVKSGLDGIVLPSKSTVEKLRREGFSVRKQAVCCSLI